MERIFRELPQTKPGGGLKDRPMCELCGRPVKVSSDDYLRDEVLCAHCALEVKISTPSEFEGE